MNTWSYKLRRIFSWTSFLFIQGSNLGYFIKIKVVGIFRQKYLSHSNNKEQAMENNNVGELIKEAAFAAFERAVELGKEKVHV